MLTKIQKRQILTQVKAYEKNQRVQKTTIPFGKKEIELEIDPYVANPNIMNSGVQMVNYLIKHKKLIKGKIVTDMGTGSGILGIAAAKLGAKVVFMSDIDKAAVKNAKKNVSKLKLNNICTVLQGDLFENFKKTPKSDVQIFNHPFFADNPIKGKSWTKMMLGGTDLLKKYFQEAPKYSKTNAIYLMPWLTLADNYDSLDNDPGKRAGECGFRVVETTKQKPVNKGLQQAIFKIYKLKKK